MPQKRKRKVNTSVSFDEEARNALLIMQEKMPMMSMSQITCMCVRTVYEYKLFGSDVERFNAIRALSDLFNLPSKTTPTKATLQREELIVTKEALIRAFGGEVTNGHAKYTKYEITGLGDIVKSEQAMSVNGLPDGEADLRRFILGSFATVGDAEAAYTEQTKKHLEAALKRRSKKDLGL